jgi:hypothetical protein
VRIRRDKLEATLLAGLQENVMREAVIDYVKERFEVELRKAVELMGGEMDATSRRKEKLEEEIANLVAGLATGINSPAVMGEIAKRERETSDISDRLASCRPDSIRSQIDRMRDVAKARVKELRRLLNGDVTVARAGLLKHVERITMETNGKLYVASGKWNLLGDATYGWCRGPDLHGTATS